MTATLGLFVFAAIGVVASLYWLYCLLRYVSERPGLAALVIITLSLACVRSALLAARHAGAESSRGLRTASL